MLIAQISALTLAAVLSFGPEVPVVPTAEYAPAPDVHEGWFDLATDGSDYFAVWGDARGPRGARLTNNGALLDPHGLSLGVPADAVIWTGTHYVVAGAYGSGEVWTQTVTRDGVTGPPRRIATNATISGNVELATNGVTVAITTSYATTLIVTADGEPLHAVKAGVRDFLDDVDVAPLRDGYLVVATGDGVRFVTIDGNGRVSAERILELSDDASDVTIAANGDSLLVVWSDGRRIRAQRLTDTGELFGPPQEVAAGESLHTLRLVPRASDFLLTYNVRNDEYALRLRRTGAPFGSAIPIEGNTGFSATMRAAARNDGQVAFAWIDDGVAVASLIPTWPPPFQMPIVPHVPLSMSPSQHNGMALATAGEDVLAAWVERDGKEARVRLGIVGSDREPAVVRTTKEPLSYMVGLAVDNGTVWVLWTEDFRLRARRFTTQLNALDTGTTQAGDVGNYGSVAVGGGAVVVTSWFRDVAATVLRGDRTGVHVSRVSLYDQPVPGYALATAASWDGEAFVIAYAHVDASRTFELRAERISPQATRLDAQPTVIAPTGYLQWLNAVRGPEGVELLWSDTWTEAHHVTYRSAPRPAVRTIDTQWCGQPAIAPSRGGFLVVVTDCTTRALTAEQFTHDFVSRGRTEVYVPASHEWTISSAHVAVTDKATVVGYVRSVRTAPFDSISRGFLRIATTSSRRRSVGR